MKQINAPYALQQPPDPYTPVVIIAGSQAMVKDKQKLIIEHLDCDPGYKPVILGDKQLEKISSLRLGPKDKKFVSLYQAGELSGLNRDKICHNIATNSKAQTLGYYDDGLQQNDLTPLLTKMRNGESVICDIVKAEKVSEAASLDSTAVNEKVEAFLEWFNRPLIHNDELSLIYQFTGKKWQRFTDNELERIIKNFLKPRTKKYGPGTIKSIKELLAVELDPMGKANPNLLGFEDGVLNKKTGEFLEHNKDDFLTNYLDVKYNDRSEKTPNFDKWLEWVSDTDPIKKRRILACLYAVLTNKHEWQLFFEITGTAASGKSMFIEISKLLSGEGNHTSLTLQELEVPFQRAKLIDKTFFYSGDQQKYVGDGGELRAITGGDTINIDIKYKNPIDAKIDAIFMMSTNTTITLTENNGGITRRRVIFHVNKPLSEEQKDSQLIPKLKSELAGIIWKLFKEFPDPNDAKKELIAQRQSAEALAIREQAYHLLIFAKEFETREECEGLKPGSARATLAHTTAIFSAYLYFCECEDIKTKLNKSRFLTELKQSLHEQGNKYPVTIRISNGYPITNIYYKNMHQTLRTWSGGIESCNSVINNK